MNRISIDTNMEALKTGSYMIGNFDDICISTDVNSSCDLLLNNLSSKSLLKIIINEGSSLNLSILAENEVKTLKIEIFVKNNGNLQGYFADFSKNTINLNCSIDLQDIGATAYFRLASLAAKNDQKNIDISIKHSSAYTFGKVDNYGVCKDDAKLIFMGTSHILNKSIKCKTQQNAKIMVFDEASNAVAKPILKIDENDIEASHAAAVGKISDEHLFYLTSRGISQAEAKTLITYGYLKPILVGFNDEDIKDRISSLIEGRM